MSRSRRLRAIAVALLAAAAIHAASGNLWLAEHRGLLSHVNHARYVAGLPPLQPHWDLTDDAMAHSRDMAVAGQIFHSTSAELSSVTTGWTRLGENVGVAGTIEDVVRAWFSSSGHRANIYGDFRYVGVGNYRAGGRVYVTLILMR